MESFNPSLAPRFTQLLTHREAELRALLDTSDNLLQDPSGDHDVVDLKDVAAEQTLASMDEVKADRAAQELEQVLAAQRRLADGSYGLCVQCGASIDLRRLTAMPAAPYCVACQSEREAGHAGYAARS